MYSGWEGEVSAVVEKLAAARALVGELSVLVAAGVPDVELIDALAGLEKLKRQSSAVQAEVTAAFTASVRAADAARGVARDRQGKSVAPQVALARGASPYLGGMFVGSSTGLVTEMPNTFTALQEGRIEEWTAHQLVRETAALTLEHRVEVDRAMRKELARAGVGPKRLVGSARALAQKLDPAAAVVKAARAESGRYVSVRPAPDSMAYLTALVPVRAAVRCAASLKRAVAAMDRDDGDERSKAQLEADLLVERLTGRDPVTDATPVTVDLVMTEETLLGRGDGPAGVPGHGPIPAAIARDLVAAAAEQDVAWVRRVFTVPDRSRLVAMDSTARCFPKGLADFLRLRDQRCATPFCEAPIRHLDHVRPHASGGPTTAANGQGLCVRCNLAKEVPGFTSHRDDEAGTTTVTTPTGHTYTTGDPPPLGYPDDREPEPPPFPGARRRGHVSFVTWGVAVDYVYDLAS
ncbi:DUF222 domain-containing protein [Kineococcus gynurae]|uniref:DUF222 domain-containing protein n=1 Tax=Kineococcus gynurae TaxID=452979 RepID=A0ABV5LVT7_9ACTN